MDRKTFEKADSLIREIAGYQKLIDKFKHVVEIGKGEFVFCTMGKIKGEHNNVDIIPLRIGDDDIFQTIYNAYISYYQKLITEKEDELAAL